MRTPRLGRTTKSNAIPRLSATPRAAAAQAPGLATWRVPMKPRLWDIGPGPWYWDGKRASRPEYITLIMLKRLGWRPRFQVNFLGGRRIPGGQVLDIVLDEVYPPIYITVKGYWHESARAAYDDSVKELTVRRIIPGTKVLSVWEKDIDQPGWLRDFLLREVGARA